MNERKSCTCPRRIEPLEVDLTIWPHGPSCDGRHSIETVVGIAEAADGERHDHCIHRFVHCRPASEVRRRPFDANRYERTRERRRWTFWRELVSIEDVEGDQPALFESAP